MAENFYQYQWVILDEAYSTLIIELEYQIRQAGDALLQAMEKPFFQIDLDEGELFVGEFDTLLNGYPFLKQILIEPDKVLLHIELIEGTHPLEDFDTLTVPDKLAILELIENHIKDLL
jgi:hypothetical protein